MDDHDFDRKARQLYLDAAQETPQAVRQRLRSTLAAPPRASHPAWQPALAFASVALFALGGLWLQRPLEPAPATAPVIATPVIAQVDATPNVAVPTVSAKETTHPVTAAYDNDPEFYAWLGNDAPPVPGER
ncbi:hypothetical protein Lysil_1713 [Lysobacter silvestris]|uniref:Uncharacterized protein n=2 Tax=Solilutibacter silvestris TaxID=1645665 RepID=A0A2K1PXX6_9GAMM|nr:hypothetical protein Lysil_1713 [Lysobacter silvestris]